MQRSKMRKFEREAVKGGIANHPAVVRDVVGACANKTTRAKLERRILRAGRAS